MRNLLLRVADHEGLVRLLAWVGRRSGLANRFVAGETIQETFEVVRQLEQAGLDTTLDLLGEGVTRAREAVAATEAYKRLLARIQNENIPSAISIKLTQLGLDIDTELCSDNLGAILREAEKTANFVTVDMEGSDYTQSTLDLFQEHFKVFGVNRVGIVIQAYLYRSEQDIRDLIPLGCHIRLCKGAYMEPPDRAFPKKQDVDRNFEKLLDIMLGSPAYSAIATHDERMIRQAVALIREKDVPKSKYEFQMLYGVRRERQFQLQNDGYRVRVYVPFGTQWAPYYIRRLAERPANLLFALKNLIRR
jgi:proline dehydrogenase